MLNQNFTTMKKLILFVCLFVAVGISANVMAQSTGAAPYPGANHNYRVGDGTNTASSSYAWSVLDDAYADASAKVTISAIGAGSVNDAQVNILWKSSVVADEIYYVQVVETNNGCTNTKAFKVVIAASAFDVLATAPAPCWTPVTVSIDGTSKEPIYNHGSATIIYTFTPDNNQGAYKFTYDIPVKADFTWATPTYVAGSGSLEAGSTGNAGTFTTTGTGAVTLTFVVTRTNLDNSTDANGDKADFTSNLTISDVKTGSGFTISESTAGLANNVTNVSVVRPNTSNINWF